MAESNGDGRLVMTIAACVSVWRVVMEVLGPMNDPSGERTMVATIPADFEVAVIAIAAVLALFVSFSTLLWRWVEHNDAHGIKTRKENPLKFKFFGGTLLAALATTAIGFFGAAVLVRYFGIAEPGLPDYAIFVIILDLFFGIALTIIFCEGITAFGKFVKQGAEKTKEAVKDVSESITAEDLQKLLEILNKGRGAAKAEEVADPLEQKGA